MIFFMICYETKLLNHSLLARNLFLWMVVSIKILKKNI